MEIITNDGRRSVQVGSSGTLHAVYSTVRMRLGYFSSNIPQALRLLELGGCGWEEAESAARQFNLIRDELSRIPPEEAVYDLDDPDRPGPWVGNLSSIVTSCANLFTTADGKDLLFEIVSILAYASIVKTDVQFC